MDISTRPRPILEKVKTVGGAVAALGGLVTWAGTFGLLTVNQTATSSALLSLVPGALAAVIALLGSFGVAKSAEPLVTPVSDPRVQVGGQLVQLVATNAPARFKLRDPGEDASTF